MFSRIYIEALNITLPLYRLKYWQHIQGTGPETTVVVSVTSFGFKPLRQLNIFTHITYWDDE